MPTMPSRESSGSAKSVAGNAKVERARRSRIPVSFFLEIYEMLGILPRCLSKTLGITGKIVRRTGFRS